MARPIPEWLNMAQHDAIAVVDFGGQYAHLIATKVRRQGVRAEIRQPEDPIEAFQSYKGIILSGSPALSSQGDESDYTKAIYDLDVPILGFCFGHQELAKHYGGTVVNGGREWGHADLHLTRDNHPLFEGLGPIEQVWMSHFDSVDSLGPGFEELGWTDLGAGARHRYAAIGSDKLRRYGFQFHAEVAGTVGGERMIRNFVRGICDCEATWDMAAYLADQLDAIRVQVGEQSVFLLASGGVDSTVAAKVLHQALGPGRVELLHVDNGLMRKGESARVLSMFQDLGLGDNLHFIDATDDFLAALEGLVEPEAKRRAIGDTFIAVFEREAQRLGLVDHLLGQGTIYPDTIETGGTKRSDTIKTHHNRVPIIEQMIAEGRVVEPLADLYKVEVRELGERLGIPRAAIWRHPFPGPGLGVRLLCGTGENFDLSEMAQGIARTTQDTGLIGVPLPIRSVGVKADLRCYEHPALLHGDVAWKTLLETASAVLTGVPGLNRCVWNLGDTAPTSFQPLAATMTRERLDLLRECDALVMAALRRHDLYDAVWQCPTVLVPLSIDGHGQELVILRPVQSDRAMIATPSQLPPAMLTQVSEQLRALPGVSGVVLDITSKPPGTIEWE
jgi:GMP synthase (glutamine-hydrolysing)